MHESHSREQMRAGPFEVPQSIAWIVPAGWLMVGSVGFGLLFLLLQAYAATGLSCEYRQPVAIAAAEALGCGAALIGLTIRGGRVLRSAAALVLLIAGAALGYAAIIGLFAPVCDK